MKNSSGVVILIIFAAVIVTALTLESVGQGQGQSNRSSNRSPEVPPETDKPAAPPQQQPAPPAAPEAPPAAATADFSKNTWNIPADADKTKNPVLTSEESVAKGKELYLARKGNCIFCHGETGAGNQENLAKLRRKPADLSDKERMAKMSDGELFWKISLGIEGIMPGREKQLTEEERWHVVNYIRTLGKSQPEM
jgi:mono/diheme cytochrome c family protein